jgi:alkylation response protein AidB-like acyl-CoA dehydrogenase
VPWAGDGWQLDGEKTWIVNATHADVMIVYAQTEPNGRAGGDCAFVVDGARAGFVRSPRLDTGAARGIDAGGFQLHGYRALADELVQLKTHTQAMLSSLA